ncbi:hypothetical protein ABL78_2545 [Leptomonas seymouri]|uniref:Uncharacterized protein n=1 Tax=Leptomonas seymouri TaxID=5684 RepID=A0A0N1PD68_LEPSE|nr:hypothetical protein ABL78_2545 [Leptomonas seymouri]|eukprot:KPI88370.1 hypothetical protein ABL78_2545 [Leptomonas seymouri]
MARSLFPARRRVLVCVTLLVLMLAITLAIVQAQEGEAVGNTAADAVQQPTDFVAPVATEEAPQAPQQKEPQQSAAVTEDASVGAEAQAAAEAEALRRQQAEVEERQRREEEEHRRQAEEAERKRREEEEHRRQAEEAERKRREEEEHRRQAEEAERKRREKEEHRRQAEEAERKRREAEEAARRAAAERAKRELDTIDVIRSSAVELPVGCAKLVKSYLFRVREERRIPVAAVSEARAQLNEARVSSPKQVQSLEQKLAKAQDALLVYDVQTLRTYGGNLPKTCIMQGQAWYDRQTTVRSENAYLQAYTHFYRLIVAHLYTMYETAEGLVYYLMDAYKPSLESFTSTVVAYQNRAWAIFEQLFPSNGSRPEMSMVELVKQSATMASYFLVPIGFGITAGLVAVIAFPPLAAGVLLYLYVYKIWAELFIFYYIYGMKLPEGLVAAAKATVETAKASQWDVLRTRTADTLLNLVTDSDRVFFNGILSIFLLLNVVAIVAILFCVWCRLCVPGMRSRKSKKSPLSATKASKRSDSKPAAPAKTKSSSPPASADKKRH